MTDDRRRTGDWDRHEWAGDEPAGNTTPREGRRYDDLPADASDTTVRRTDLPEAGGPGTADRWNKTQWVGDQGHGAPEPVDPDAMPEGENRLSGDRHNPGEEHWARGQSAEPRESAGDRPLDR